MTETGYSFVDATPPSRQTVRVFVDAAPSPRQKKDVSISIRRDEMHRRSSASKGTPPKAARRARKRVRVAFRDGHRGTFDCKPYRGYACLAGIWADGVFDKVVADHGTVMWPDGSDLCPDEVYENTCMTV